MSPASRLPLLNVLTKHGDMTDPQICSLPGVGDFKMFFKCLDWESMTVSAGSRKHSTLENCCKSPKIKFESKGISVFFQASSVPLQL